MVSRIILGTIVLLLAMTGAALSEPKRVLIVHSVGRDFSPWDDYARTIRAELARQSKDPIDIFETSLTTARFADGKEGPFVDYLNALFSERQARPDHDDRRSRGAVLPAKPAKPVSVRPRVVRGA